MSRTVIISCINVSTRLKYVSSFIFEQLGGFKIEWLHDGANITDHFISYGPTSNEKGFLILPDGYLDEGCQLDWQINGKLPDDLSEISEGFDFLSFVFRHLSRFEEIDAQKDVHGRFLSKESWNAENGWLRRPVVDRVIQELFLRLNDFFKSNEFQLKTKYSPLLTVDVDFIYAFKRRGWLLSIGSGLKDFLHLRWQRVIFRILTTLGLRKDPYDEIHWMVSQAVKYGLPTHLFYLVGGETKFDRQGTLSEEDFSKLNGNVEIGLHPSYGSGKSLEVIKAERSKLEELTGRSITISRFHFLRLQIPDSYQLLEALNFKSDHSLLYVDEVGFRAGTCHPFQFYDVESEAISSLIIKPAIAMDVVLKDKLSLDDRAAIEAMRELIAECRLSRGDATILWHNSSFDNTEGWKGWREVFISILREMTDKSF